MALYEYDFINFNISFPRHLVAHVEIHRPSKRNAFNESMWVELRDIFHRLSHDPDVRAVVLSGAGTEAFSTGMDFTTPTARKLLQQQDSDPARKAVTWRRWIHGVQDCFIAVQQCEKPVICVAHGFAWGLALDLCCLCDIRICSTDTHFSVKEVDFGIVADLGSLQLLPKIAGNLSWAKEVCITARGFRAEEALQMGFVSKVEDTKAEALTQGLITGELIASKSPIATQGTKEILNYSLDHSFNDALKYTGVWNSVAAQSKDILESLGSGMKDRNPTFEKL
ncbi:ClpP/crotonase-like domain-containing protein [Leptodontidium sp. 2 PMI_412]|nr:enoyl-CoA hydratase/isomerase family protein [Leptodontidium sp. MPI-SDFR-AT-0119]KAH9204694.1 ClpP/crotonase-like domain-containing protein [Leptodontidium sp. 2 PMI_412]